MQEQRLIKRFCGRPFAPDLTVRAGGDPGRMGAVVPCCMTMGPPNEAKSILGHLDKQTFEEVYFGKKYEELRQAHEEKDFDRIEYCKNCDLLYEDTESLVWTNDKTAKMGKPMGVGKDFNFNLIKYNKMNMFKQFFHLLETILLYLI